MSPAFKVTRRQVRSPADATGKPRLLIVNADDYGLTAAVAAGILRGHRDGIVTSTSVLALAPAFAETGPWLHDAPGLGVGVHLAAVGEDPPLLQAAEIPSLVDRQGRLAPSWRTFLARASAGRVDRDDLRREFSAQLERVAAVGVPLTHLDTHQHLHLWPSVRGVVLELAKTFEIPAIRVPRAQARGPVPTAFNRLAHRLQLGAETAGLRYPAATGGFDESGHMHAGALAAALDRLAATGQPTLELMVHPGEAVDADRGRYRWGYQWGDELDALVGAPARDAVARHDLVLGSFASL